MSEPIYRQATNHDAPAIAEIAKEVSDELGEASGFRAPMTMPDDVLKRMSSYNERSAMFLCESDAGVCGFALLEPVAEEENTAVMGTWVRRDSRRRGIGRELALMALDFARTAGYRKVQGTLPEGNEPALSFFGEIGALAQVVGQGMQYELPL